jgi:predicted O-methyltransferase YrrM
MVATGMWEVATLAGKNKTGNLSPVAKKVKNLLKSASFATFLALDRVGVHLLPKWYYTPVPNYSWLRKNRDSWQRRTSLAGLRWDLDEQLAWLREVCEAYYHEVEALGSHRKIAASGFGQGYGPLESQVLHCFIRSSRPTNIIEIGSGESTAVMLRAAKLNEEDGRRKPKITAVEPFPKPAFSNLKGEVTHIEKLCQEVPQEVFDQLGDGDLLFIDSSHAVKTASDVLHIYLEVIPRLQPGVFVQIHDISLPYLFHRTVLSDYFSWQETSLVLALLTNNAGLSVLCCQSALHYDRKKGLSDVLTDYRPQADFEGLAGGDRATMHFPSSLWLRTSQAKHG